METQSMIAGLRICFLAAWLWIGGLFLAPAVAQQRLDLPAPDRSAIETVIRGQISAFRRDDGPGAFGFATPSIQGIFQTPEIFMDMVRTGYLPVYRPRDITFKDIVEFQGQPTQTVVVVGPDGVPVMALYMMQRQPDGSWLINGCTLLALDDKAA
jgi:hypothetical protein